MQFIHCKLVFNYNNDSSRFICKSAAGLENTTSITFVIKLDLLGITTILYLLAEYTARSSNIADSFLRNVGILDRVRATDHG